MNETALSRAFQEKIKKEFPGVPFWKISDRFGKGYLDLLINFYGRFVWMEAKDPNRKAESRSWPMQKYTIDLINRTGGFASKYESVEGGIEFLKNIKNNLIRNNYMIS